jgi:Flp pilus assembly protein TadD
MTFADGKAAYDAKKYSDATAIFERYTGRRPDNAWGHYMLGLSAWKDGNVAGAESAFEKALSIDPRHVKSLVNLSRVLIDQKRHDDAIDRLTRAADIDPESTEVNRLLGRTYAAQGKTEEAMQAYRRAIELNELDAWSMNNLGLLFLEKQRAEEALSLFTKAAELRKEVPAFHNNLGMALEHTGRFRDAAVAYNSALTADPGYYKAKQNLARVEAVKGDRDE